MNVTAVVLAAGQSSRMGRPKQTLPFGVSTVVGTVVAMLLRSSVGAVIVVVGHHRAEVQEALPRDGVCVLVNPSPDDGMLSSIQCAVGAAPDGDGWLVCLGDQPQLEAATVDALIAAAEDGQHGILVPTWQGRRGHPLLLLARLRDAILSLPRDVGLNALLAANPGDVAEVPVRTPSVLRDIDTPEDYQAALREQEACGARWVE